MFVEQPGSLPAPPAKGRVAVVDVAFAGGDNFEKSTVPFLEALGDRLAIWIDHHEHPLGWSAYRNDRPFGLAPTRVPHACRDLVTPRWGGRAGRIAEWVAKPVPAARLSAGRSIPPA